eukprot:191362-Amphidinium_carterae.1
MDLELPLPVYLPTLVTSGSWGLGLVMNYRGVCRGIHRVGQLYYNITSAEELHVRVRGARLDGDWGRFDVYPSMSPIRQCRNVD